ncbi:MAG: hypothetical protein ACLRYE_00705 [Gemmiger formicilis]|uniref:hypothetical protein n=1 Tax=Gemmiger formicilis TaxID=745368 RepID=UPI0039A17CBB
MKNNPPKNNPRYANGSLRRKHRARLRAMGCECGICHGRFGPIHYDEPSDAAHPLSFVVDEIRPVSKWRQFGYSSAARGGRGLGQSASCALLLQCAKTRQNSEFFA